MAGLCCGKNVMSLVLPDNRSCFVLIELLFFSIVRSAASGSAGFCHPVTKTHCTWVIYAAYAALSQTQRTVDFRYLITDLFLIGRDG